jgi:hypothetical protein
MEFSRDEVASIVGDDTMRHAETAGDALEELDGYGSCLIGDEYSYDPFGEIVGCN